MSASSYDNDKNIQWAKFDKYSIKVIDHAIVDIIRSHNAKKRKGEFAEYDINLITTKDIYPSENVIFDGFGNFGIVESDWLYEAMLCLDDRLKQVLLLKYWYKWSRAEMAAMIHVSEKTITNRKNKAFEFIRKYRERMLNRDIRGP